MLQQHSQLLKSVTDLSHADIVCMFYMLDTFNCSLCMDSSFEGKCSASYVVWRSPTPAYPTCRRHRRRNATSPTRRYTFPTATSSVVHVHPT